MKRFLIVITLVVLAMTQLPAQTAHAIRMARGANGWYIGQQGVVCRDGATLAWLWYLPTYSDTRSTLRIWEGNAGTGRLIALAPMSPTVHSLATVFDLDDNGARQAFKIYAVRNVTWFPLLAPGSTLTIEDPEQFDDVNPSKTVSVSVTVQNCTLATSRKPALNRGTTKTISPIELPSPSLAMPDHALRYQIEALPTHGTLTLNNSALVVGNTFTQNDIAEGRLKYAHNNDTASSDTFRYRLDGMVRVSLRRAFGENATEANGASRTPKLSGNGGMAVFASDASNLDDTQTDNATFADVYVWLGNQLTRRVSQSTTDPNQNANAAAYSPALSADGARIAFASAATDLVLASQDCMAMPIVSNDHVFRRDVDFEVGTGIALSFTLRQSVNTGAPPSCALGNSTSYAPAVDEDGGVAFLSGSDNFLLPNPDENGMVSDVFRRKLNATTLLAVRPSNGSGYFGATGFAVAGSGSNLRVAISAADGFTNSDNNGFDDVYVQTPAGNASGTVLASVGLANAPANGASSAPAFSRDGVWLAFESDASNLVAGDTNNERDVFVRNLQTGVTTRASVSASNTNANSYSGNPQLSADGRWLTFVSNASNLVAGDTNNKPDVFVRDLQTNQTSLVSQAVAGIASNGASANPDISDDGHHVIFESLATNLVSEGNEPNSDVDGDVFVRYLNPSQTFTLSVLSLRVFLPQARK